jgi:cell division protein ZapE
MHRRRSLEAAYRDAIEHHGYASDPAQLNAVARLEDLRLRLQRASRDSPLGRIRSRISRVTAQPVRGLYLWGGVGRGKTFLMDLFHAHAGVPARREHFHHFMKGVHDRLRRLRDTPDPLARVAIDLAGDARVLCVDELYVGDIGDAMILSGVFGGFIERGLALVFTSNSPPSDLYREGLQRARFLPAIALLTQHTEIVNVDAGIDYRLRELERAPLYFDAAAADAERQLAERFESIAGDPGRLGGSLEIENRAIPVRRIAPGVVWFDFAAICDGPRSAADYVEIARDHHTVLVSAVPRFDATAEDQARRFIALIDELYDRNVKLVLSASATPDALYAGERLGFEFARTRSRLTEMQSHDYLARPHKG